MTLAYAYQRIMDSAATLGACITDVIVNDREALGPRGVKLLDVGGAIRGVNEGGQRPDFLIIDDPQTEKDVAADMSAVASWIARDRRDALCPAAADKNIVAKGGQT